MQSRGSDGGGAEPRRAYDRVVFINDVYFCPWHVLRLLEHTLPLAKGVTAAAGAGAAAADWACGLDFKRPSNRDIAWRTLQ